jgi:hypothetical protein
VLDEHIPMNVPAQASRTTLFSHHVARVLGPVISPEPVLVRAGQQKTPKSKDEDRSLGARSLERGPW